MKALELNNIHKSYLDGDTNFEVLRGLDLSVEKGEFVAILGPSGSGKSTLLSIAGLLLNTDEGTLTIDGETIQSVSKSAATKMRKQKLGFIFQTHHLLPYLKGKEQVTMAINKGVYGTTKDKDQAVNNMFAHLGIEDCLNKYPNKMSGGQRQRIAIARAFINKPTLILADEPTASLDGERGRQVVSMIRQEVKRNNTAAIMVTHDERVLDLVDTVYRLEDGKLIPLAK